MSVPPHVIDMVLHHSDNSTRAKHYPDARREPEVRQAMQLWADRLVEIAQQQARRNSTTLPLKYECVYLNAYLTGSETRAGIGRWISYYNTRRPHSSLGPHRTPDESYVMQWEDEILAA